MPNGSSMYWASALLGMDSLSSATRRASLISATTNQMGLTIRETNGGIAPLNVEIGEAALPALSR